MGLDTYAGRSPVDDGDGRYGCTWLDRWAFRRAERRIERDSGGTCLFTGNYFRGKLYVPLVRFVSGRSLSEEWIDPDGVCEIAEAFRACHPYRGIEDYWETGPPYRHGPFAIIHLREFFDVCERRGLGLIGSY